MTRKFNCIMIDAMLLLIWYFRKATNMKEAGKSTRRNVRSYLGLAFAWLPLTVSPFESLIGLLLEHLFLTQTIA